MIKKTMKAKNLMVSFVAIVCALFLVATVSAYSVTLVEVNDDYAILGSPVSITAGEKVKVEVSFTADMDDEDVTVNVEIEGDEIDVEAETTDFEVEDGYRYKKTLVLDIPNDLDDAKSEDLTLTIEIDGDNDNWEGEYTVHVQRPSYNPEVKSISVDSNIEAGDVFPVDVVIKNTGYNDLDDLYVTVSIPALGIAKSAYLGDIVAIECSESEEDAGLCDDADDEDTVFGRLYLEVPYSVEAGIYSLELEIENDDTSDTMVAQIVIGNDFSSNVITSSTKKTVAIGEDAEYELLLINPTDGLMVFTLVSESADGLSTSVDEAVVAVPAGSSKTVTVTANANEEGEYEFTVNVLSQNQIVETATFKTDVEGTSVTNPIVILTVILVIVFLVLLIVLIVLIGKKPEKSEEFGESYY